jgi:integrase
MTTASDDGRKLPANVYRDAWGYYLKLAVGSASTRRYTNDTIRWPFGTPDAVMIRARDRERARLEALKAKDDAEAPGAGTLEADVVTYFASDELTLTTGTRKARTQQLAWWCAQLAALDAPVVTPDDLAADPTRAKRAGRLGLVARRKLEIKRLKQILARAFKATDPDKNPTEFANTSNQYRTALGHLFTILDADRDDAVNPIRKIAPRPRAEAKPSGIDMRVVAEILAQVPSRFGRSSRVSQLRLAALAWNHITPIQLQRLNPARDFHDLPDATRDEIFAGAITLDVPPRFKGRQKRIPAPKTVPLNPWGAVAMRELVSEPAAWTNEGTFSLKSLNIIVQRAAERAQAALAKRGVMVDLSGFTLYHLKHSLSTAALLAAPGLINAQGQIVPTGGLQAFLGHQDARTTRYYTQAAVDPLMLLTMQQTTLYLEALFKQPLRATAQLRLVAGRKDEVNEP